MVHAGNCTRVQEYQTCAAALQQIVGHAASGRVPHENPSEVVLLAARWTSSPSKFATKIGVVLDPEVGLWRVANIEAGVMAAVSRVIPELAVCGTEGSDTLARVVRRHVWSARDRLVPGKTIPTPGKSCIVNPASRTSFNIRRISPCESTSAIQMPLRPLFSKSTGGKNSLRQTGTGWDGGWRTVAPGPAPLSVMPSLAISRFSRYVPGPTHTVAPAPPRQPRPEWIARRPPERCTSGLGPLVRPRFLRR